MDGFQVNFVKGTMFKGIIERKTREETRKWIKNYVNWWRESLTGEVAESVEVVEEEVKGILEWIKDEKHLFQVLIFLHGCVMAVLVVGIFRMSGNVSRLEGRLDYVLRLLEEQQTGEGGGECNNMSN